MDILWSKTGYFVFCSLHHDNAIVVASLVSLAWWRCVGGPLPDLSGKDLQKFSRVQLYMENGDLCQEGREEDGVEGLPVLLLFGACEVAGGGAKKDLRDR